ncbi:unnamed protein product [Cylicocyclus nassatus]|uniref:Uncharacterized protein n=1 Tax=Cylicocyclus nassatus TaxID=53992 RepID=A0AA36GXA5_CYLNA|nr:unnamed protein product [Cylicocyclus nassatus]
MLSPFKTLFYFFLIIPVSSKRDWCADYYMWNRINSNRSLYRKEGEGLTQGFKNYCQMKIHEDVPITYVYAETNNPLFKKIHHWMYVDCLRNIPDTIIFKAYHDRDENWEKAARELALENEFLYPSMCNVRQV